MRLCSLLLPALLAGCVADPVEDVPPEAPEVPADDGSDDSEIAEAPFDPAWLQIGFNAGFPEQFAYFKDYYARTVPQPRMCRAYFGWDVANQAPGQGDPNDQFSRAFVERWFARAQGECDEALISFKAKAPGSPPATNTFAATFERFASYDWAARTGFTGKIQYLAWNEPNNGAPAGNGLGAPIPPRVAARYYLATERACRKFGCTAVAGGFASNGTMWDDFRYNCANDNVEPADLCAVKSTLNPDGRGPSYLNVYKNEIVDRTAEFGLPSGFRPAIFAYHGWHDTNSYIDAADHCSTYETCTLRRLVRNLAGTWGVVELWNTEDGVGQTSAPDDTEQACAAAFLLRLNTLTPRVKRVYITRLNNGPGQLVLDSHEPRPALEVFAKRQRQYTGATCP